MQRTNASPNPLSVELARIGALDETKLRQEVAYMAACWAVEHATDLEEGDGVSGTAEIAAAYVRRLGEPAIGERAYLSLLRQILERGVVRTDRTGTGTRSLFGVSMRFDLREGFPLITTKKVQFGSVVKELLWFLRGSTNIADLGCGIWNDWTDGRGEVGPVYGYQWRSWGSDYDRATGAGLRAEDRGGIDQISEALDTIKNRPDSRRIVVSAWNVADLPKMRLPPCHLLFQFYVDDGHLDCQMYQRSADMALGVPFNIASYALLLAMFAQECKLVARHLTIVLGDAHVYADHVDGVRQQLAREPLSPPRLVLADKPVLSQAFDDVRLEGYEHHPAISFRISV